jgi:hypothetical protein
VTRRGIGARWRSGGSRLVLAVALTLAVRVATQDRVGGTSPPIVRLIVQGDDMAVGHGVNEATVAAFDHGVLRATNVIVPGPWLPEAVRLLAARPGLDVGIHLALTSEWSAVKWRPLTSAPSLVDENGFFLPMVWRSPRLGPQTSLEEATPELGEIERELRAQIVMARRLLPRVSYTWEHMGLGSLRPAIRAIVTALTKEYGLVTPGPEIGVQFLPEVWTQQDDGPTRARKLAAALETLGPGTWVMVDHAATDTPEIRAFGHPGYEAVAADRSAVLSAWTSPLVREAIARRGIVLTNYRELLAGSRP